MAETSEKWRSQHLMAGARRLLKKAISESGGSWSDDASLEDLARIARIRHAPIEDVVNGWAAFSQKKRIHDSGKKVERTPEEFCIMHEQAELAVMVFNEVII